MQELYTYGLEGGRLNYVRFRKYSQLYYICITLVTYTYKKVIELLIVYIILILREPVLALTTQNCVLSGQAANTNSIVISFDSRSSIR